MSGRGQGNEDLGPIVPRSPLRAGPLIDVLAEHKVDYIVVGGWAVVAYGKVRATKDIDICPDPDPQNLARLGEALSDLEAEPIGLEEFEGEFDLKPDAEGLTQGGNWLLDTRFGRLDIMQFASSAPHIDYQTLDAKAEAKPLASRQVRFCSYEDLLEMKEAAGRDQDLIDIRDLRAARGEL